MYLIVIASAVIELLIIFKIYPFKKAIKRGLIYIDLLIFIAGYICYIIKTGGHRASIMNFMMIFDSLTKQINNLSISYTTLYSVIQISRLLFPYLLICIVVDIMAFSPGHISKGKVKALLALPSAILIILNYHPIYRQLFAGRFVEQNFVQFIIIIYILLYFIVTIVLLVQEIHLTSISWYKRQNKYLLVSLLSVIGIYFIFSFMDPILLLQDYQTIKVGPYSFYINYKMDNIHLLLISLLMIVSITTNTVAVLKDAKIELDRNTREIKISTTLKETDIFTRGLLHGLKNRILAEKVQTLEILEMLDQTEGNEEIKSALTSLFKEQNKTYTHLDMVNKALRGIDTHLRVIDIAEVFSAVEQECKRKYSDTYIYFSICEGSLLADKALLVEALMNLIDNAVEANSTQINILTMLTRVYILIEVEDDGCGMSHETKKKLFLPFNTTKNTNENWGIGLCFTRQVIKKHLGDIQFKSTEKTGSVFYITLPRID